MAIATSRRRAKNPEGRMALREHLAELRRRLVWSSVALFAGALIGWFFLYEFVVAHLQEPLNDIAAQAGRNASLNFGDIMGSFNLKLKISGYLGLVASSPVWLYQIWAFVMPGLTKKERRYGIAFVAAAVPLFCGGILLAWAVLPRAVAFLTEFAPEGSTNFVDAQAYFSFTTRLMLAFGIAFVLPLFLVAMNVVGVLSGAAMGRAWRMAVFVAFLFAAVVSPSPEPAGMFALALPMIGLYVLAVGVSLLNDRRRRRRREDDPVFGLADDEASPLRPAAAAHSGADDLGPPSQLPRPQPLDGPDGPDDRYEAT